MRFYKIIIVTLLFFSQAVWAVNLIIEPNMGYKPIMDLIQQAQQSLKIVMYKFNDYKLLHAVINAHKRGVDVTVLIQQHPYKQRNVNAYVIRKLKQAHVKVIFASNYFRNTHQKSILIDNKKAAILTFNFSPGSFKSVRNLGAITTNFKDINCMRQVFWIDLLRQRPQALPVICQKSNLVWSPHSTRKKLQQLLNQAQKTILIYAPELQDYQLVGDLKKACDKGVKLRVLMPYQGKMHAKKSIRYLVKHGATIHFAKKIYIHAKMILIDPHFNSAKAYVGSANISKAAFDDNRELGIIIAKQNLINKLASVFDYDWLASIR